MENEEKASKGSGKKRKKIEIGDTKEFDITYEIQYEEEGIDLSLNLKNPAEDRFFAYSLTLMDLYETMSDIEKHAPKEIIEDFMTALKIVKAMAEAVKLKIEVKAGIITEEEVFEKKIKSEKLSPENKERLKKMIAHFKDGKRGSLFSKADEEENGIESIEGFSIDASGKSEKEVEDEIRKKMESVLRKISNDINGSSSEEESEDEKYPKKDQSNKNEKRKDEKPKFLEDKFQDKRRNEDLEM